MTGTCKLSDPTGSIERKNNAAVKTLHDNRYITSEEKAQLTTYTSVAPRIYGHLKYHKPGNPLRPIVSTIKSPCYKLSRFLATILRKAFKPKYNIKNSMQFVRKARQMTISDNNILVSFDVVNCFAIIPTKLAISIIIEDFALIQPHTHIPKDQFVALLKLCLEEANYFSHEDKFYRQVIGMFMGSSLAPILVERVLERAVDATLSKINVTPDFWYVYVDDHLTSIPAEAAEHVLTVLNEYHPSVQFTIEKEHVATHSINFLDITVFNENGVMKTKWYCKPIASNRLLNYYSAHPDNMKNNVAKAFIRRVLSLSHSQYVDENLARIRAILAKNNFPVNVCNELIHSVMHSRNGHAFNNVSYPYLNNTTINNTVANVTNV